MRLADLADNEFRIFVDKELRKDHPSTPPGERERLNGLAPQLREPDVLLRWITALEMMKASSETQLGAKRAETKKLHGSVTQEEYETKLRAYQGWKAGNVRFLNTVQDRLREARALRSRIFGQSAPTRLVEERNLASQAYIDLIRAVENHRDRVIAEYDEPSDADEELWENILPDKTTLTVAA